MSSPPKIKFSIEISLIKKIILFCGILFKEMTQQTENYFLNLVKSNQIWTVITLFRLFRHQTELDLTPNQLEKRNYNRLKKGNFV